jgi:transposase
MYSRIQAMKEQGFSIRQASRIIRISRNTIRKYWEMEPEEYADTYKTINRATALAAYAPAVLKWLEAYPCMTASQVRYWLEEKHGLDASDRTVRRFVAKLREEHGICRESEPKREYEAVEELPMGFQMQLDFGEKSVRYSDSGRYVKLHFAVFTLSYSRHMWGTFQPRPFSSADLVSALYGSFGYFGGRPRQLVYDQDSIIVVSENGGDIIHTQAFSACLSESKLEIRACRKSDPETKGLIESSVKFVKGNFMENRLYMGIDIWNRSFDEWLEQAAKRKHGTTKRKPAEMFAEEQEHLLPLYGMAPAEIAEEMSRTVRKDNTIWYRSNRYSVPYGTYADDKEVLIEVEDGELRIMSRTGDPLGTHKICGEKGRLVKLDAHRRDRGERARELRDKAAALLGGEFREYLEILCERKPRYVKDQLAIILAACETYGRENVLDAVRYCRELGLYSAGDLRDAAGMISGQTLRQLGEQMNRIPLEDERYHVPVQKRDLSAYAGLAAGSGVAT